MNITKYELELKLLVVLILYSSVVRFSIEPDYLNLIIKIIMYAIVWNLGKYWFTLKHNPSLLSKTLEKIKGVQNGNN